MNWGMVKQWVIHSIREHRKQRIQTKLQTHDKRYIIENRGSKQNYKHMIRQFGLYKQLQKI